MPLGNGCGVHVVVRGEEQRILDVLLARKSWVSTPNGSAFAGSGFAGRQRRRDDEPTDRAGGARMTRYVTPTDRSFVHWLITCPRRSTAIRTFTTEPIGRSCHLNVWPFTFTGSPQISVPHAVGAGV
jgi:hypothetical protein